MPQDDEREDATRAVTLRGAAAWIADRASVVTVIVHDFSDRGCRLETGAASRLPDRFDLALETGIVRSALVAWRGEHELGVRFLAG